MKRVSLLILALALALSCAGPERDPDIVLITIDTLRADHLGIYGGRDTPRIDAFAQSATIYEDSLAPMPMTRPSHFSMLTSLYPREHGVLNNAIALPEDAETLTELMAARGYATGGFVGVKLLGPASGAGQGFMHFEEPRSQRERPAETVVTRALEWVGAQDAERPYFLWVHLFDPHLPYAAPGGEFAVSWDDLEESAENNYGNLSQKALEYALDAYREEVRYVDTWVGKLLDGLEARGGERLTILTADHGECFERGIYFEHADCLWEGAVRIPMVVQYPGGERAGKRIAGVSSIVDVAPTVMSVLEQPAPAGWSGVSLTDGDALDGRSVLIQHPFYQPSAAKQRPARRAKMRAVAGEPSVPVLVDREQVGVIRAGWKFIRTGDEGTLYPRRGAERDLSVEDETMQGAMSSQLDTALEQHELRLLDTPEINAEMMEMLCALGYVDCPDGDGANE